MSTTTTMRWQKMRSTAAVLPDPNKSYRTMTSVWQWVIRLLAVACPCLKAATIALVNHYLLDIIKPFKIGNDRSLKLNKKNDGISIEEKGSKKAAHLHRLVVHRSYNVWIKSTTSYASCLMVRTWHTACIMSLTKKFRCVDLWKFFIPTGHTMRKPTKTSIAQRLNEWPPFKQAADKLHRDNPTVANFTPCFLSLDLPLQSWLPAVRPSADNYDRTIYRARRRPQFRLNRTL